MKVSEIVDRAAERWAARPALHDAWGTLTYADLRAEVERLAAELTARRIGAGCGLGLLAGNDRTFLIGLFAGLKCGAVVMPLPFRVKPPELRALVDQSGVHFLLGKSRTEAAGVVAPGLEISRGQLRLTRTHIPLERAFAAHVADPAVVRFTSGTTGTAKGVVISHRSVFERIEAAKRGLGLGPSDTVLWVLPMTYHFVVSIILYVYCGSTIAVASEIDTTAMLETAHRVGATLLYASPFQIRLLAAHPRPASLATVTRVISTTAAISAETCRLFARRYGREVCQAFGIIEVGLPILNLHRAAQQPEAIGEALPEYEVAVLDRNLQSLPPGAIGQLAIRGPGLFDGYLSPPLTRAEVLQQGWFLTGDLASRDEHGVIVICGRAKSAINVAGTKVFPEEIEQVLGGHPAVARCRVFGKPHPLIGEYVAAEVQISFGHSQDGPALSAWCRQRLSAEKVPRVIEFVDRIAVTGTGKVIRA